MKTSNGPAKANTPLSSPVLQLQVAAPGTRYQSSRFDHSSIAYSLIFDNQFQCLGHERELADTSVDPHRGQGLACEFGIHSAIGYQDCPVGDWFPKLGVGFIRRESQAEYNFFHHYAEVRPLSYRYSNELPADAPAGSQAFTVIGSAQEHRGYAWSMARTWLVHGNVVENRCTLSNTGAKALETTEYSHNFIRLGSTPIGPTYQLDFNFPIKQSPPAHSDPSGCLDGTRPVFKKVPEGEFYLGELQLSPIQNPGWTIANREIGLSIQESVNQTCTLVALWGKASVISPELFIDIKVRPGQSFSWTRRYTLS